MAGCAASEQFGVAKEATVLDCHDGGPEFGVAACVDAALQFQMDNPGVRVVIRYVRNYFRNIKVHDRKYSALLNVEILQCPLNCVIPF